MRSRGLSERSAKADGSGSHWQFSDDMLTDAPRVFERLREGLTKQRKDGLEDATGDAITITLAETTELNNTEEKLTILADTSYGACCVDEVAAEQR